MRLALCRLCQYAGRLQEGNPILVGLFSRIECSTFPARLDPCYLAVEIESDPTEVDQVVSLDIRLIDEDGRPLANWDGLLELPESGEADTRRTFFTLNLPWGRDVRFDAPGRYRFDVVVRRDGGSEDILGGESLTLIEAAEPS
ncbi:MAG: hypothetical protein JST40_13550 [Armatimonadetes bacterium]|nr:hypothetical protein [Armatimonadota bacterium]